MYSTVCPQTWAVLEPSINECPKQSGREHCTPVERLLRDLVTDTPPMTAPPTVPAALPPVSTAPPTAPTPAPIAVLCPCDDIPEQAPRPSKVATANTLNETFRMCFMERTPFDDLFRCLKWRQ